MNWFDQILAGEAKDLGVDYLKVDDTVQEQVFLVWQCKSAGLRKVTDTFLFDKDGVICKRLDTSCLITLPSIQEHALRT